MLSSVRKTLYRCQLVIRGKWTDKSVTSLIPREMSVVMRSKNTAFVAVSRYDGKLAREFPRPRAASAKPATREERVLFCGSVKISIYIGLASFMSQALWATHKSIQGNSQHSSNNLSLKKWNNLANYCLTSFNTRAHFCLPRNILCRKLQIILNSRPCPTYQSFKSHPREALPGSGSRSSNTLNTLKQPQTHKCSHTLGCEIKTRLLVLLFLSRWKA